MADAFTILTFAEIKDGKATPAAREAIGVARKLADEKSARVTAVIIGHDITAVSKQLISIGADKVINCESQSLLYFLDESYSKTY